MVLRVAGFVQSLEFFKKVLKFTQQFSIPVKEFGKWKESLEKWLIFFFKATILDKTVEKIVYLDSIFLNIVAVPVLPSFPQKAMLLRIQKKA